MYSCCLFQYTDLITVVGFILEAKLAFKSRQLIQEHLKILSRSVENMASQVSTPDSPDGFWKLSEEIFKRISDKSEHVNH